MASKDDDKIPIGALLEFFAPLAFILVLGAMAASRRREPEQHAVARRGNPPYRVYYR